MADHRKEMKRSGGPKRIQTSEVANLALIKHDREVEVDSVLTLSFGRATDWMCLAILLKSGWSCRYLPAQAGSPQTINRWIS
jgi:hypothetical protein